MSTFRSVMVAAAAAMCCTAIAPANNPPAINLATLARFGSGHNVIVGSTSFSKEGTAYCAPDVPYVNWYTAQLNSPRRPTYTGMLSRYTRTSPIGKDGSFQCRNLARGRYVVWIEGDRRVAGSFATEPNENDNDTTSSTTGQVTGTTTTSTTTKAVKNAVGSDAASSTAHFFVGPKHVMVTGMVRVSL